MLYTEMRDELCSIINGEKKCSDELFSILQKHKCLYLLSKVEGNLKKYSSYLMVNQIIQNYRFSLCEEIFKELYDIPYAVIKGAVLSERIYGEPYYRSSGDIDLLISPEFINSVSHILERNGFVQGKVTEDHIEEYTREEKLFYRLYTHQVASFEKKTDSPLCPFLNIDVNFDLLWGEANQRININEYLLHTEKRTVCGVEVYCLSSTHEFIALCLHHYKDMNSCYLLAEKGIVLSEYLDIFFYLIHVKPNINELNEISDIYNVKEYIYYCIYFTNEIFRNPLLEQYLEKLETQQGKRLLEYYGLCDAERKKWDIPFLERVFDNGFKRHFLESLELAEQQKIGINMYYRGGIIDG